MLQQPTGDVAVGRRRRLDHHGNSLQDGVGPHLVEYIHARYAFKLESRNDDGGVELCYTCKRVDVGNTLHDHHAEHGKKAHRTVTISRP